jgi:hypothetical protein
MDPQDFHPQGEGRKENRRNQKYNGTVVIVYTGYFKYFTYSPNCWFFQIVR